MREVHQRNVAFYVVGRFKIQEGDVVVLLHVYIITRPRFIVIRKSRLLSQLVIQTLSCRGELFCMLQQLPLFVFFFCANRSKTISCRVTFFFLFVTQVLSLSFGFIIVLCNLFPQKVLLWSIKVDNLYVFQRFYFLTGNDYNKKGKK